MCVSESVCECVFVFVCMHACVCVTVIHRTKRNGNCNFTVYLIPPYKESLKISFNLGVWVESIFRQQPYDNLTISDSSISDTITLSAD